MITEGGEVVFVGRMVKESLQCGERIRCVALPLRSMVILADDFGIHSWFSSLLGKYSSVGSIVAQLKAESVSASSDRTFTSRSLTMYTITDRELHHHRAHTRAD